MEKEEMKFFMKRGLACRVRVSERETDAVKIAAENLRTDLKKVFGEEQKQDAASANAEILAGTLGVSEEFDALVGTERPVRCGLYEEDGKLRREGYVMYVQDGRLIIAGTDRRGTVYGIYELCGMLGVSPWYFWADVPVKEKEEFELPEDFEKADWPSVEYRGIFINDEEELDRWVQKHMGEDTIGVKTYEKVFELLLRLKGNYIWPAMHVNSFNMKRENGELADRMGIVVGTSHCDMLMRSNNREWKPWTAKKGYTDAVYDYSIPGRNRQILQEYWRESVEQNRDFEVCYTLGMRGIHDSGFETEAILRLPKEEQKAAKVKLLETVIRDQRQILKETLGHDTMMTFIPYKEVLELYDAGLEVPEDMTLVWANDNYGYVRRYPSEKEKKRSGGNGLYYHNSYWAPPSMSYVFLCSIPLAHTAYELQKAWKENIRKLWVINTGAMKPLEQEIEFFLRLAWEIGKEEAPRFAALSGKKEKPLTRDVDAWVADWITRNFSGNFSGDFSGNFSGSFSGGIGGRVSALLNDFSQLTNVRKVENMDDDAFSQTAYGDEAAVRIHKYEELFEEGNAIYAALPEEERDAFFQLVLMRIHAAYFTNLAYYYGDRSTLACRQGKAAAAAEYVRRTRTFDDARRKMILYYNKRMADGKWDGILDPEGFPPPRAAMLPACTPPLPEGFAAWRELKKGALTGQDTVLKNGRMILSLWNEEKELSFTGGSVRWLEIGNGAAEADDTFEYDIEAPDWLTLSSKRGKVGTEIRILATAEDTGKAARKAAAGRILVKNLTDGGQLEIPVSLTAACPEGMVPVGERSLRKADGRDRKQDRGSSGRPVFVEDGGLVCVEADAAETIPPRFRVVKRAGRCAGNLVECCEGGPAEQPLRYPVCLTSEGEFLLELHRFPSLNATGRIRIGVSVDGGQMRLLESESTDEWRGSWKKNVLNNAERLYLRLPYLSAGVHELCLHAVDRYFAFSRLVIYTQERKVNNLAGVTGCQELPKEWDTERWCEAFYGKMEPKPRAELYEPLQVSSDNLAAGDIVKLPERTARPIKPEHYLEEAETIFAEQDQMIRIDTASALAGSEYARVSDDRWQYCAGETFGRSGLAMYIRGAGRTWEDEKEAPGLHYRVRAEGGDYVIWLLCRFGLKEESRVLAGVDGKVLTPLPGHRDGFLWRYEAEQVYRWVPLAKTSLAPGAHTLEIYAMASGMRFERICLVKGEELPPSDLEWEKER
ncbi:MAG TPA: glycosyl hydrolase 115 family protein [Candidatus Eisenbergiella merdavium]|uniref:Glycosyl hydrolase 115 family protein n=1 Tax=Candidatus Eisenbergiella merdavium TaxID=2838551 RepID=A0A9D2NHT8_9FIRM|nr:glycosyl hydrolase 115 family protein [Candidatus Eisenbergiella merdavium]